MQQINLFQRCSFPTLIKQFSAVLFCLDQNYLFPDRKLHCLCELRRFHRRSICNVPFHSFGIFCSFLRSPILRELHENCRMRSQFVFTSLSHIHLAFMLVSFDILMEFSTCNHDITRHLDNSIKLTSL